MSECVCVCVCMCMCMCVSVCVCTNTHSLTHKRTHSYTYTYIVISLHIYIDMHTPIYTRTSMYTYALMSSYRQPRIRSMKIIADRGWFGSTKLQPLRCVTHSTTNTLTLTLSLSLSHTQDTTLQTQCNIHDTSIYTKHSIHTAPHTRKTPYTVNHTDTQTRYTTYLDPAIDTAFNHTQTSPAASFLLHTNLGQTHWADARVRGVNRRRGCWRCAGRFPL